MQVQAPLYTHTKNQMVFTVFDLIRESVQRFDSFVARLSRSYPGCATVHVARPARSILDFARNDRVSYNCGTKRPKAADVSPLWCRNITKK